MTAAMDFVLEEIDLGFARFSAARKGRPVPCLGQARTRCSVRP